MVKPFFFRKIRDHFTHFDSHFDDFFCVQPCMQSKRQSLKQPEQLQRQLEQYHWVHKYNQGESGKEASHFLSN